MILIKYLGQLGETATLFGKRGEFGEWRRQHLRELPCAKEHERASTFFGLPSMPWNPN